jgi:hypothetical protein
MAVGEVMMAVTGTRSVEGSYGSFAYSAATWAYWVEDNSNVDTADNPRKYRATGRETLV